MWKDCISIEGLGRGMWKDFVAINGSECVRALICIAIDDIHWEVVEESNHLHSRRLQIAYKVATVNPTKGITYSEARSLMAARSSPGDSLWQP